MYVIAPYNGHFVQFLDLHRAEPGALTSETSTFKA